MPHTITCPTSDCGRQLRVPDDLIGKKVKCPSCGSTFVAQGDEAPPPPEEQEEQQEEERPSRRNITRDDDEIDDDRDDRPRKKRRRFVKEHRGAVILVLGILSIVLGCVGLVLGPIAWSMANADLPEIRAGRMDRSGEGITNAGRICGIIGTILNSIEAVCCVGYFLFWIIVVAGAGAAGGLK